MSSSALDTALTAHLLADAQLTTLLPDGVYFELAPQNGRRFILITVTAAPDVGMFPDATGKGRAFEEPIYAVVAVVLASAGDAQAAEDRLDAVLEGATLTPTGYGPTTVRRIDRIRRSERDPQDTTQRWHVRGGEYMMTAAPL